MENLSTPQPTNTKPADNTATNLVLPSVGQQLTYPLDYTTQEILRGFMMTVSSQAFPVGSIFISVVSTNPATLLGYGTWSAFATGKTLVGIDTGDADFDTVEEAGGNKSQTLSNANLPATTFNVQGSSSGAWGVTAGSTFGTVTGSATPISVVQPYIITYMWKRTA